MYDAKQEIFDLQWNMSLQFYYVWIAFSSLILVLRFFEGASFLDVGTTALFTVIPAISFMAFQVRTKRVRAVQWGMYYLLVYICVEAYERPNSFSQDVFLMAPLAVVSFMVLSRKQALVFSGFAITATAVNLSFSPIVHGLSTLVNLEATTESGVFIGLAFVFTVYIIQQFRKQQEIYSVQLDDALVRLNRLNTDNELLISLVTHDINNHLFRALGYYEQLQRDDLVAEKKEKFADAGVSTIMEITNIIRNLVSIRQLTEAEVSNDLQAISLEAVIEKTELLHHERISEKEITIQRTGDAQDADFVTEPLTFSQHLFGNILSNAIKFAPVESVVSINALNDSENYYVQVINLAEKTHLENLDQVNSKSQVKSLPGTKGETGQGLGGQIVNQVARKLGIGFELRVSASDGGLIKVIAELKIPKPSQEQLEAA